MIILLNGPSSSGKSSLSKALQTLIENKRGERYGIVSIDDFMKLRTDETIYEDDVYEISGDMCAAVTGYASKGTGVIIDHVITSERIYDQLTEAVSDYGIYRVHVTCPLDVLLQREQARGNRCGGSAEASFTYLFPKEGYDLEVDTNDLTSQQAAELIYVRAFGG